MNICVKCGKLFKIKMKIDGKMRWLHTRKYCLECSPFGSRNTRTLEEKENNGLFCKCGEELIGNQTKYCSVKCKHNDWYKEHQSYHHSPEYFRKLR